MKEIDVYQKMLDDAEEYYNAHREEIDRQRRKQKEREIIEKFAQLEMTLGDQFMVWCRNGRICREATPCHALICKYKKNKSDIQNGCSKCQKFQVTTPSNTWPNAIFIYPTSGD